MNLWVRSQYKNKLVPINDELYIPNSRTGEDFGIFYKDKMLGYYKTKERALEVLDEIEERIMLINTINLVKDVDSLIACKNALTKEKIKGLSYPYQMPEK